MLNDTSISEYLATKTGNVALEDNQKCGHESSGTTGEYSEPLYKTLRMSKLQRIWEKLEKPASAFKSSKVIKPTWNKMSFLREENCLWNCMKLYPCLPAGRLKLKWRKKWANRTGHWSWNVRALPGPSTSSIPDVFTKGAKLTSEIAKARQFIFNHIQSIDIAFIVLYTISDEQS